MRRMTKFILMGLSAMSSPTVTPVIVAAQDLEPRVRTGGSGVYTADDEGDRQDWCHVRTCERDERA